MLHRYISLVAASCMVLYGYDASVYNSVQGSKNWVAYFNHPACLSFLDLGAFIANRGTKGYREDRCRQYCLYCRSHYCWILLWWPDSRLAWEKMGYGNWLLCDYYCYIHSNILSSGSTWVFYRWSCHHWSWSRCSIEYVRSNMSFRSLLT